MGHPEGKYLDIDTLSQNRLNPIKNQEILKNGSRVLGVTPGGYPYFRYLQALFNVTT